MRQNQKPRLGKEVEKYEVEVLCGCDFDETADDLDAMTLYLHGIAREGEKYFAIKLP